VQLTLQACLGECLRMEDVTCCLLAVAKSQRSACCIDSSPTVRDERFFVGQSEDHCVACSVQMGNLRNNFLDVNRHRS
jgi:hypothetical protein